MGVRGLQTCIEKDCPLACKTVNIKNLADDHKNSFGCEPVLVVDGMILMNNLYKNSSLEWIYGGQWLQFVNLLTNFISRFSTIGVKLVLIFDGNTSADKREEWVRRRNANYKIIADLFREIKSSFSEPDKRNFQLPTSLGTLIRFSVKDMGAEVYQTDRDADEVIAEYANKHEEVFGILSQDSDFIIYETKMYLSLSHLDSNSLQTILYDRKYFATKYLKLDVSQLPLFACLNGNDYVHYAKLKHFHRRISKTPQNLSTRAKDLANFIKKKRWSGDMNNKKELVKISQEVFRDSKCADVIQSGLKSYHIGQSVPTPEFYIEVSAILQETVCERHKNCKNSYIFNLMRNMEYDSSEPLEDSNYKFRQPSPLIYREIRQRCYRTIFRDHPSEKIKEYCAYPGNKMEQPKYILQLDYLEGQIPTIEDVWFKYSEPEKMKLFWSILQVKMDFEVFKSMEKNQIVLACVLNFLIGGQSRPLLKPREVAVFVAQALIKKDVNFLEQLKPPRVYADAVSLCTVFMRGVLTVLMVHSTCDSPFPIKYVMPWEFFDGKLFHHVYAMYAKTKHPPTIHELCCGQEDILEGFYDLLSIVTRNTKYDVQKFEWGNILRGFDNKQYQTIV